MIQGNLLVCEAVAPGWATEQLQLVWVCGESQCLPGSRARVGDWDLRWDAESSVGPPFMGAHRAMKLPVGNRLTSE